MKKIVLSLAVIAASGAFVLKDATSRFYASGPVTPVAALNVGTSGLRSPSDPRPADTAPVVAAPVVAAPVVAVASNPVAVGPAAVAAQPVPQGSSVATGRLPAQPVSPPMGAAAPATPTPRPSPARPAAQLAAVTVPPTPTPAPSPPAVGGTTTTTGQFKDGTFTGGSADAYYGYVQVRAVVKGGKLASVDVLTYPADRSRSREINSYALPLLQREVVQAQGVSVRIVSGATLTSRAYMSSLNSALKQAAL